MILRWTHIGPVVWMENGWMIHLEALSSGQMWLFIQRDPHCALWVLSNLKDWVFVCDLSKYCIIYDTIVVIFYC